MRCFLMARGQVQVVEVLEETSDDKAIERGFALLRERSRDFKGFEVWDRTRLVHRYLPAVTEESERDLRKSPAKAGPIDMWRRPMSRQKERDYRDHAEEARTIAGQMKDLECKRQLLQIAEDYERYAVSARAVWGFEEQRAKIVR